MTQRRECDQLRFIGLYSSIRCEWYHSYLYRIVEDLGGCCPWSLLIYTKYTVASSSAHTRSIRPVTHTLSHHRPPSPSYLRYQFNMLYMMLSPILTTNHFHLNYAMLPLDWLSQREMGQYASEAKLAFHIYRRWATSQHFNHFYQSPSTQHDCF